MNKIISKKKPTFTITEELLSYLKLFGRLLNIPISYDEMLNYEQSFPVYDLNDHDTLWESLIYSQAVALELNRKLTQIYAMLKMEGDLTYVRHLEVERIDFCTFGNSKPFRVRIKNMFNDNYDYFYIKKADASRVYGLELEDLLSPNRISYYVSANTLIEEHIAGVPGDDFILHFMNRDTSNRVRIAKEFVKFSERCFVRLLGDMRSYNYVIDITPDFDNEQYRVRAIDFDQQSYEGKKIVYLPQFFKENKPVVDLVMELLNPQTIKQYQFEERTLMHRRYMSDTAKVTALLSTMTNDSITTKDKMIQLRSELAEYHENVELLSCESMGQLVQRHIELSFDSLPDFLNRQDQGMLGTV